MTVELPKRDVKHVIGEEAVRAVEAVVPKAWIVREQSKDYGIDLEIELARDVVSGRFCKAQVKGHDTIKWTRESTYLQQVEASTMNYWAAMPVPVFVLVPETSTRKVYWALSETSREGGGVRMRQANVLPSTIGQFESAIVDWLDARNGFAVLNAMPTFLQRWKAAQERVGMDCFMPIEDEEYGEAHELYGRVRLLRQALGLSYGQMVPWDLWCARSRVTFGKEERFYWGTYDEMIGHLTPLVDETIEAARLALEKQDPQPGNVIAKEWASRASRTNRGYIARLSLEDEPQEFWREFDEKLRAQGILKYRAADGVGFQKKK